MVLGGRKQPFPRKAQQVAWAGPSRGRSPQQSSRPGIRGALAAVGDFIVRAHKFLSLFAASLIAFAPFHSFAQEPDDSTSVRDRPRPEYDPLGMRFGGFNLHANLDLGIATSDNIFAEETGQDDDTIFTAALNGRLESGWSRHALAIEAGGRSTSYDDFSSEDTETGYAGIRGRLDIGARSNISGSAYVAHEVEPRNDPDGPIGGDPVEYDRSSLQASAQHTFNRVRVTGTVARTEYDYDGAQNFRDFDETSFTGRVEAAVSPRIGLLLQATGDERDYDNAPPLSSDGRTVLVGATINFTDLMRGEIAVGQFDRDYDFGGSTDGVAVAADLEWYITRLTTLAFHARRNSEDVVGGTVALPYVESRYGGRVDHELLRNVILTAGVELGKREYDIIDRDDDFVYFEAGADYLVNRRVVLRGRFVHDEVESDGVNRYRDYEENRFSLGVSFRL